MIRPFLKIWLKDSKIIYEFDSDKNRKSLRISSEKFKLLLDILPNAHIARVPLVYILCNLLNIRDPILEDWEVKTTYKGELLLKNSSQEYPFHAVKAISEMYSIQYYKIEYFAVVGEFLRYKKIIFYKRNLE